MPMQRHKPEQVVTVLRQIEVAMANGKSTPQACKDAGIHKLHFSRESRQGNTRISGRHPCPSLPISLSSSQYTGFDQEPSLRTPGGVLRYTLS